MSVWYREEDGTYVAEMSEFSRTPNHPVTGKVMYLDDGIGRLMPHIVNEEILWWYGTLADGTRVLIHND